MSDRVNRSFGSLLQSYFMEYLINQRHLSPRTIENYRDTFRLLLQYMASVRTKKNESLNIDDINANVILDFLEHLEVNRGNCVRTRNVRLSAIHSFMQYVSWQDPQSLTITQGVLAIPMKRYERTMIGYLTQKEIQALVDAPNIQTWSGQRDHALFTALYNTGARASEIIALQCCNIEFTETAFIRILGKGRKERTIPLWKSTSRILRNWISQNQYCPNDPLFPNRFGKAMTRSGLENRIQAAQKSAMIKCKSLSERKVTPHLVRHATAMHLLQAGVDLSVIAMWLGHESIATTHHYLEADLKMKTKALKLLEEPKSGMNEKTKPRTNDPFAFLDRL